MFARINRGIIQAKRACRIATSSDIHRADHVGGHIGPGPPFFGHRQVNQVFALGHLNGFHGDQMIAHHGHQGGTRVTWHKAQLCGVADLIGVFVQPDLKCVRGIAAVRRGIPSGPEPVRGRQVVAVKRFQFQLILAPVDRGLNALGRIRRQCGLAV